MKCDNCKKHINPNLYGVFLRNGFKIYDFSNVKYFLDNWYVLCKDCRDTCIKCTKSFNEFGMRGKDGLSGFFCRDCIHEAYDLEVSEKQYVIKEKNKAIELYILNVSPLIPDITKIILDYYIS